MRKLLICLLACFALACEKGDQDIYRIKIVNDTHLQLENVRVGEVVYGNLAPGANTEYKKIPNNSAESGCEFTWASEEAIHRANTCWCGNEDYQGFPPGDYIVQIHVQENFIFVNWRRE